MNLKQKKKIVLLSVFFGLAILASFYFDKEIAVAFSLLRTAFLNDFFKIVTFLGSFFSVIVLSTLFFLKEKRRKLILPLWFTLGVSALISFILKISIQRLRPFQFGFVSLVEGFEKLSYSSWDFSFPSSHAMFVFAVLPFITKEFPKFKYVWIVFALLVAFSRIYFGLHFLSDILIGSVLGFLIGFIFLKSVRA